MSTNPSTTPRTDAAILTQGIGQRIIELAHLARQLEIELGEANKDNQARLQFANSRAQAAEIDRDYLLKLLETHSIKSDPQAIPTDSGEHYVNILNQLRAENTELKMRISGELSENCPICKTIGGTGNSQDLPMCYICQLESNLDYEKCRNTELRRVGCELVLQLDYMITVLNSKGLNCSCDRLITTWRNATKEKE